VTPNPSAFMMKMSKPPPRVDWKTIFVPSGDHDGCESDAPLSVKRFAFAPLASMM
jgi:hypothetical protein